MSDTQVIETDESNPALDEIAEAHEPTTEETAPVVEDKPKREPKPKPEPHACLCSFFRVGEDLEDGTKNEFTTECTSTTARTFAQGHDARLVSFLVSGELDGYKIWRNVTDTEIQVFEGAVKAAGTVTEALRLKADKALGNAKARREDIENRQAARKALQDSKAAEKARLKAEKAKEKAEREAAKPVKPPKAVAATVVAGSQEGDAVERVALPEPEDGETAVTIKVGRNEYLATLTADGQTVRFMDKAGELQTREAATVRIIEN